MIETIKKVQCGISRIGFVGKVKVKVLNNKRDHFMLNVGTCAEMQQFFEAYTFLTVT